MAKLQLDVKQTCLPCLFVKFYKQKKNLINCYANKFLNTTIVNPFQYFPCSYLLFVFAVLFIPSFEVLSTYQKFFTQFGDNSHCLNIGEFCDTAPFITHCSVDFGLQFIRKEHDSDTHAIACHPSE